MCCLGVVRARDLEFHDAFCEEWSRQKSALLFTWPVCFARFTWFLPDSRQRAEASVREVMSGYIVVTDDETKPDHLVELPVEPDGLLLLSTLDAQFSEATGLKFRAPSGVFRGLRVAEGKVHPPESGWETASQYVVVCKGKSLHIESPRS